MRVAAGLARGTGAKLRVITVLKSTLCAYGAAGPGREAAERRRLATEAEVRAALAELTEGVDAESDAFFDDPTAALVSASRHVDLLVMGTSELGAPLGSPLGGVPRPVTAVERCPVLVLSPGKADELAALLRGATARAAHG